MNRTVCSRRDRILPRAAGRKALACLLALVLTAGLGGLLSVSADTATDGYYETKTTRVFTPFALKKTASYEATDEFTASTADSLWQFGYTTGGGILTADDVHQYENVQRYSYAKPDDGSLSRSFNERTARYYNTGSSSEYLFHVVGTTLPPQVTFYDLTDQRMAFGFRVPEGSEGYYRYTAPLSLLTNTAREIDSSGSAFHYDVVLLRADGARTLLLPETAFEEGAAIDLLVALKAGDRVFIEAWNSAEGDAVLSIGMPCATRYNDVVDTASAWDFRAIDDMEDSSQGVYTNRPLYGMARKAGWTFGYINLPYTDKEGGDYTAENSINIKQTDVNALKADDALSMIQPLECVHGSQYYLNRNRPNAPTNAPQRAGVPGYMFSTVDTNKGTHYSAQEAETIYATLGENNTNAACGDDTGHTLLTMQFTVPADGAGKLFLCYENETGNIFQCRGFYCNVLVNNKVVWAPANSQNMSGAVDYDKAQKELGELKKGDIITLIYAKNAFDENGKFKAGAVNYNLGDVHLELTPNSQLCDVTFDASTDDTFTGELKPANTTEFNLPSLLVEPDRDGRILRGWKADGQEPRLAVGSSYTVTGDVRFEADYGWLGDVNDTGAAPNEADLKLYRAYLLDPSGTESEITFELADCNRDEQYDIVDLVYVGLRCKP